MTAYRYNMVGDLLCSVVEGEQSGTQKVQEHINRVTDPTYRNLTPRGMSSYEYEQYPPNPTPTLRVDWRTSSPSTPPESPR